MIRRSPTRIELKLEDLSDFEYIQKFDKKKNPPGGPATNNVSEAQKLRQERIGLGFRPVRTSSTGTGSTQQSQGSLSTPPVVVTVIGSSGTIASGSGGSLTPTISIVPITVVPTGDETPVDLNVTNNNSTDAEGLNLIPEVDESHINNSTMSLDESL